jgi:aldose 1-epimerase
LAPEVGANLFQFSVGKVEYLFDQFQQPLSPATLLGTPILYPTPNRVRDARFLFDGSLFTFEPNDGTRFLHGLVRHARWEVQEPQISGDQISVTAAIVCAPGSPIYQRFPIANTLSVRYTLAPNSLRLDFAVENQDAAKRLPFGLAIHPYFRVHGPRSSVRIVVPAQRWMKAVDLLPTGELVDMAQGPADMRQPTSLSQLNLDDVFWGMGAEQPAVIYYDHLGKQLTLHADSFFTHAVVYTPSERPYFCIENQSCSTDAHNLDARGLSQAAHLAVLDPGERLDTWIAFRVTDI